MPSSKSRISTASLSLRAANRAASLTTFAISAPTIPGVQAASFLKSTFLASLTFRAWISNICSRPFKSGRSTTICRSNLPGLSNAWSRISGRLVAARIMTPFWGSNPSISVSNCVRVCSCSSAPETPLLPLALPTASISSIKIMQGAFFSARSKSFLTLAAPTPANISTKAEPVILKKGTLASPATAWARRVLPEPGGPTRRTPFGILAPRFWNRDGLLKNSMTSLSSSSATASPATSGKVTLDFFSTNRLLLADP